MSSKNILAGEYKAKARNMRYVESGVKGTPGIEIQFEFEDENGQQRMNWTGWISEKARTRTMDTLVNVLDYNGDETTDEFGNFTSPTVINKDKEVKIVVEINEQGWPNIKWVNNTGGGGKFKDVQPEGVKAGLAANGFKAAFLAAAHDKRSTEHDQAKAQSHGIKKDEKLPF